MVLSPPTPAGTPKAEFRAQRSQLNWQELRMASDRLTRDIEEYAGRSVQELDGEQFDHAVRCPFCGGGPLQKLNFSVHIDTVEENFAYTCWRANNCGEKGYLRFPPSRCLSPGASRPPRAPSTMAAAKPPATPLDEVSPENKFQYGKLWDWLVKERRIDPEVLRRNKVHQRSQYCKLSRSKTDVLVFPYYSKGELVAEKFRALPKAFWQRKGGQRCLYGVDSLQDAELVILTEGEIDKLSVETAGFTAVASIQGGAEGGVALSFGADKALQAATTIVLAMDMDECGRVCALKTADFLFKTLGISKCRRVTWREGCKDANEVLIKCGQAAVREDINAAEPLPLEKGALARSCEETRAQVSRRDARGVSVGFPNIDKFYRAVAGELTLITGAQDECFNWLQSLVMNLAEGHRWRFLICTPLAEGGMHKSLMEKRRSKVQDAEHDAMQFWFRHFRYGYLGGQSSDSDSEPLGDKVLQAARREARSEEGLQGLVLDARGRGPSFRDTLAELRRFASETGCHIWVVQNLQRPNAASMHEVVGGTGFLSEFDNGICVQCAVNSHMRRVQICIDKATNTRPNPLASVELVYNGESCTYQEAADPP